MSYWIPSAILVVVLLVLIAQLPWRSPGRRSDDIRTPLDLGDHKVFADSPQQEEDEKHPGRDTALSNS